MFILIPFGFSVGFVIAEIGGVEMRRAMGHLEGVEIGPMFLVIRRVLLLPSL